MRPLLVALLASLVAACGVSEDPDPQPTPCPEGPEAPLGLACDEPGLRCAYGYDPPECGGRTVECVDGTFVEFEHTDPQPGCFEDAGSDASDATDSGDTGETGPDPVPCGAPIDGVVSDCGEGNYCNKQDRTNCWTEEPGVCKPIPDDCPTTGPMDEVVATCTEEAETYGVEAPNPEWTWPSECHARRDGYHFALLPTAELRCEELAAEWRAFVDANRTCSEDADCIVVGGSQTCDCAPAIGAGSGDGIARDALDDARGLFDRFRACIPLVDWPGTCDAAPARVSCVGGSCVASERSCLSDE